MQASGSIVQHAVGVRHFELRADASFKARDAIDIPRGFSKSAIMSKLMLYMVQR